MVNNFPRTWVIYINFCREKAFVTAVGKFILVVLLCVVAALLPVAFHAYTNPPRSSVKMEWINTDLGMYVADPILGSKIRENLDITIPGPLGKYKVITGEFGQRSANLDTNQDGPVALYVGGSQSFGSGLPAESTAAAQIAKATNFKVLNLSVPGYGSVSSLLMAERHLDKNPNFIIYGFWEDHLRRNVADCAAIDSPVCFSFPVLRSTAGSWSIKHPSDSAFTVASVREYYSDTAIDRKSYSFLNDIYWTLYSFKRQITDLYFNEDRSYGDEARIDAFIWLLDRMNSSFAAAGTKLIVVYIPTYFKEPTPIPTRIERFLSEQGIRLADLTEEISTRMKREESFTIEGDGHLNAEGHMMVANAILPLLRD